MSNIKKPCMRNCCLNENDVCLGCFRTLNDMRIWYKSSDEEKREMLNLADKRKMEYKEKYAPHK
ncbi:MAG: DUF1289 domain-containing protein [Sulfurovum sp.]|nr:MAG: DUF1289 domain-containing protein [Sulfurovum sp.]